MFGLPDEFLSKMGILGGNPDRAGIQVAFAHHDAADRHQRCSGKSEFFRTKHSCDYTSLPVLSWPSVCSRTLPGGG